MTQEHDIETIFVALLKTNTSAVIKNLEIVNQHVARPVNRNHIVVRCMDTYEAMKAYRPAVRANFYHTELVAEVFGSSLTPPQVDEILRQVDTTMQQASPPAEIATLAGLSFPNGIEITKDQSRANMDEESENSRMRRHYLVTWAI